ncbi:MAG TPA: hypothetical protein VI306_13805 [Pyrinomonadaceae bacterium]
MRVGIVDPTLPRADTDLITTTVRVAIADPTLPRAGTDLITRRCV